MPSLRTNLLRIQLNSLSLQYQLQTATIIILQKEHHIEIQSFFNNIQPNLIYAYPYIYCKVQLNQLAHEIYMSNGQCISIKLQLARNDINNRQIIDQIATKMIKISQLLYCQELGYCMNPYQQRKNDKNSIIPAYTIKHKQVQQQLCLLLVPMFTVINFSQQISQKSNVLIDYSTGNFYSRQNIVRFDKQRGNITFRNNKIVQKSSLHAIDLKIINGFDLGNQLYNFYDRLKQTTKNFRQLWQLKLDNYFLENQYTYTNPGSITFRTNIQKSLAQIITPMNQYSWIQKLKSYYSNINYDDLLNTKIVFIYTFQMQNIVKQFTKHLEAINYRMGNHVGFSHKAFINLNSLEQIRNYVKKYQVDNQGNLVYFIPYNHYQNTTQKKAFQIFVQLLIDQKCLFHLVEVQDKDIDYEAELYRHIAMIYAKLRLNPWKIKAIPFTNKPMVVMTLDISLDSNQQFSISLVSTMNLYLSKFTCSHKKCQSDTIIETIELSIKECIQKFKQAHKIYPCRIFLIRNGISYDNIIDEYNYLRSNLQSYNGSKLTYITLSTDHYLRTFTQLDQNYVSKDNVKKIQLLAYNKLNSQLYYQLQLEQSMHLVRIYQIGEQDPNFTVNILELLAKIVFGSVGNRYGKGLGFIDFSKKLNEFRQFNLNPWAQLLKQGYVTFI